MANPMLRGGAGPPSWRGQARSSCMNGSHDRVWYKRWEALHKVLEPVWSPKELTSQDLFTQRITCLWNSLSQDVGMATAWNVS